jgi:hypothetical protein
VQFVAVDFVNFLVITSTDGKAWKSSTPPCDTPYLLTVAGSYTFLVCEETLEVSTDAVNWKTATGFGGAEPNIILVKYLNGAFVALGIARV